MCSDSVQNGRFNFEISYRNQTGDQGLSIVVMGHVAQEKHELLRFDCFLNVPHYHTAVYDHNTVRKIESDDAVAWSLDKLASEFEDLIVGAGGDPVNENERHAHAEVINAVRSKSKQIVSESQS